MIVTEWIVITIIAFGIVALIALVMRLFKKG